MLDRGDASCSCHSLHLTRRSHFARTRVSLQVWRRRRRRSPPAPPLAATRAARAETQPVCARTAATAAATAAVAPLSSWSVTPRPCSSSVHGKTRSGRPSPIYAHSCVVATAVATATQRRRRRRRLAHPAQSPVLGRAASVTVASPRRQRRCCRWQLTRRPRPSCWRGTQSARCQRRRRRRRRCPTRSAVHCRTNPWTRTTTECSVRHPRAMPTARGSCRGPASARTPAR